MTKNVFKSFLVMWYEEVIREARWKIAPGQCPIHNAKAK